MSIPGDPDKGRPGLCSEKTTLNGVLCVQAPIVLKNAVYGIQMAPATFSNKDNSM